MSHHIALSKVPTNAFSGEPPSKRFVLVLRALLRHPWAPSFGALTHYGKPGNSKSVPGHCATHLMFLFATVSETAATLLRYEQKWGRQMHRYDWELLDKQTRRLSPPRNDGVIALMLGAMFLVGMTLGSVLTPHQGAPTQIAAPIQIATME